MGRHGNAPDVPRGDESRGQVFGCAFGRTVSEAPGGLKKAPQRARIVVLISTPVKSHTEYLTMNLPARRGFVNLTPEVRRVLGTSGIQEGLVLVNAMHITASVFINDDERGLHHDYEKWLERLAPHAPVSQYQHNETGEDNADAHLKRQVMGREVVVAVTKGELDFGPWEQIFYGEFDGRRKKRVLVKVIGE
jgi:secondary thiamine-phosphate synthase enzyme